jgi:hypothetical protein
MSQSGFSPERRTLLKATAALAAGAGLSSRLRSDAEAAGKGATAPPAPSPSPRPAPPAAEITIIGPRKGYTPMIGTLVSMLNYTRWAVLRSVEGTKQADLDYLLDAKANTIGGMLMHLAATDTYYHLNTFQGMKWGSWPDSVKQKWDSAMTLGDAGRRDIKGHDLDYYVELMTESRERTLAELRKRDDKWLLTFDPAFKANNQWKWFHVCEHESSHGGQIRFLKGRLPGAKGGGD